MTLARSRLILSLLFLFFAGCSHAVTPGILYSAVIENVEDLPGQHYSPAKGQAPMSCIHLRLIGPMDGTNHSRLRVLVLGLYRPDLYGQTGDQISFRLTGRLPLSGKLWIEQLDGYRVRCRR